MHSLYLYYGTILLSAYNTIGFRLCWVCGNSHIWEADGASGHWLLLDATGPVGVLCLFGPEGLKDVSELVRTI